MDKTAGQTDAMTEQPIGIYQTADGQTQVEVRFEQETVWLSLQQMTDIFGRDKSVISRHLKNIFTDGKLEREAVVSKMQQLLPMVKLIRSSSIIWMLLFRLAIG